jgi:hypothetical protein
VARFGFSSAGAGGTFAARARVGRAVEDFPQVPGRPVGHGVTGAGFGARLFAEPDPGGGFDCHGGVMVCDEAFGYFQGYGPHLAVGGLVVPPDAHETGVHVAGVGSRVDQ